MYAPNYTSEANPDHPQDHQYGRRMEVDRSWTVYHVFTGVPADADCGATTGLSRVDATDRMMSLNRHAAPDQGDRTWLKPPAIAMPG